LVFSYFVSNERQGLAVMRAPGALSQILHVTNSPAYDMCHWLCWLCQFHGSSHPSNGRRRIFQRKGVRV